MALDEARVRDLARSYTEAWCTHDPTRVAGHYVPGGTITINGGDPTEITEVARSFVTAFPDIQVFMDDLVVKDETVEYHWTFTGTNHGPDGTGKWVRISGYEEWTLGEDGLVVSSRGSYDQDEYDRQLEHGAPESAGS
jgi:nuclear transport factor 2 (NTF2) superfamily protein